MEKRLKKQANSILNTDAKQRRLLLNAYGLVHFRVEAGELVFFTTLVQDLYTHERKR